MKKGTGILAICLLLTGLGITMLPWHMEFTGYVLLLLGGGCALCVLMKKKCLRRLLVAAMAVCSFVLLAVMGLIGIRGLQEMPNPDADYAVVLGAQIYGDQPSRILRERLDRALVFMEENPEIPIIVSGGYGTAEQHSEARVMRDYLVRHGADANRIYLEDAARNTRQNLRFSVSVAEELGLEKTELIIISSRFHLCRAVYIAESLGLSVGTAGAKTEDGFFYGNYLLREAFSFVKAFYEAK